MDKKPAAKTNTDDSRADHTGTKKPRITEKEPPESAFMSNDLSRNAKELEEEEAAEKAAVKAKNQERKIKKKKEKSKEASAPLLSDYDSDDELESKKPRTSLGKRKERSRERKARKKSSKSSKSEGETSTRGEEGSEKQRSSPKRGKKNGKRNRKHRDKSDDESDDEFSVFSLVKGKEAGKRKKGVKKTRRASRGDPGDEPSSSSSSSSSSSPSSSSSSEPSSDSSGSESSSSSRRSVHLSHKDRQLLKGQSKAAISMATSLAVIKEKKDKKTFLGKLLPSEKFLLRVLTAESWDERGLPKINRFTKKILGGKQPIYALNIINQVASAENWDARVEQTRFTDFITRGLSAEYIEHSPGGFTVFMFKMPGDILPRNKADRLRFYQESFGDGRLTRESIETMAESNICLPRNRHEGKMMIRAAIQFLHKFTHNPSIATAGYEYGLQIMRNYDDRFSRKERADPMFVTKFLYLLDTSFQALLVHILGNMVEVDPVRHLRNLKDFMKNAIHKEVSSFLLGTGPAELILPEVLSSVRPPRESWEGMPDLPPPPRGMGPPPPPAPPVPPAQNPEAARTPRWFRMNPAPITEWAVPQGRRFGEFFNIFQQPENFEGFPHVRHHVNGRPAAICIKYQVKGRCDKGPNCHKAHIHPRNISEADRIQIKQRLEQIYGA
ncbi:MAG: hypothetical protein F6J96_34580 [Symploca sp. SIO1C2]|nr:hypothetical protein [Symploca sp. SIO1C2]